MKLSPAWISFTKGIGVIVLFAVLSFLGDASHLSGIVSPTLAAIIAGCVSAYEAKLKENSGNTSALFGAVKVKEKIQ